MEEAETLSLVTPKSEVLILATLKVDDDRVSEALLSCAAFDQLGC